MTPESNKTEGLPETAERDVTQRISAGAGEQPDATERRGKENRFWLASRGIRACQGWAQEGPAGKADAEPQRA